ncbi:MAG: T9SS type A sorting domain-containing protein, partial [Flavobacteriaceae bacterium]|nr:T9SS type A sorting domain-containing protein [Flavobacteriaceae bacterium]
PGDFIPVGQGFFVNSNGGTGNIIFENDQRYFVREGGNESVFMRVRSNSSRSNSRIKRIKLDVKLTNGVYRPLLLGFVDDNGATDGVDWGFDAKSIDTDVPADAFWRIEDANYLIQGVGSFDITKRYPLRVKSKQGGKVGFKVREFENFDSQIDVYLYDAHLGTYNLINTEAYFASLEKGADISDRFFITFQSDSTLEVPKEIIDEVFVNYLTDSEEIFIKTPDNVKVKQIYLINMVGQTVKSWNSTNAPITNEIRIPVTKVSDGNYIIKLQTDSGTFNKKVIIKQ